MSGEPPAAAPAEPPATATPPPRLGPLQNLGRALRHRNYRLFFAGQTVSMIGTWITRVAIAWLVYRITGSAWWLGVAGFVGQIPTFLVTPLAGVLVDRWNRHRVLLVTQVLAMLQSGLLAGFALTDTIDVPHILVLAAFQGLINAFDMPARQAFLIEMIDRREDLPNAIALNSSLVNLARLLGPSIGGYLIYKVGEGWCFTVDAISYLAVIASLLAMRVTPRQRAARSRHVLVEMREGFHYVARFAPIRALLLLLALVSLMGAPYTVLMPMISVQVLHGGSDTLGILMAATGLGALCGALYLASRQSVVGLGRVVATASIVFGAGLIAFALSTSLWLSLPLLLIAGMALMVQMAASNTILQTLVDEGMRGRVMSFYSMAFFGTMPLGSLVAGALAAQIGAPETILVGGVCCIAGGLAFRHILPGLQRLIRPIYVRLGILPGADPP